MDDENQNRVDSRPTAQTPISPALPTPTTPPKPSTDKRHRKQKMPFVFAVVLMLITLVLAITGLILTNTKADETEQTQQNNEIKKKLEAIEKENEYTEKQVDKGRVQAVFLSSGQVYFGSITEITRDTIKLEKIYYLKGGTVDKDGNPPAGADVSLVKLGKELHAPDDVMFIERKNISFWENLKNDGEVTKAIEVYEKQN